MHGANMKITVAYNSLYLNSLKFVERRKWNFFI